MHAAEPIRPPKIGRYPGLNIADRRPRPRDDRRARHQARAMKASADR